MPTPTAKLDLAQFAGFIPGDWTVRNTRTSDDRIAIDAGDSLIAEMWDGELDASFTDAAARLIAAAPALLSECKRLRAENERLREALQLAEATICRLKPPVPYDSTQGTRDVIRAALEPQS